jgi:hypothetical protein
MAKIRVAAMHWSTMINTTSQEVHKEEIQISENEMASDPDGHRSLSKYRRVPFAEKTIIAPANEHIERGFPVPKKSVFSHAGHAVIL